MTEERNPYVPPEGTPEQGIDLQKLWFTLYLLGLLLCVVGVYLEYEAAHFRHSASVAFGVGLAGVALGLLGGCRLPRPDLTFVLPIMKLIDLAVFCALWKNGFHDVEGWGK